MKHVDVLFTKLLLMITNVNNLHINFERLVLVNFFPECAQTGEQKNNSLKLCSNFYTTHSQKKKNVRKMQFRWNFQKQRIKIN